MARGRQPTATQLAEEAHMEVLATAWELLAHDRAELAGYRRIAEQLDTGDVAGARATLADLFQRDIEENRRHRSILRVARGEQAMVAGTRHEPQGAI